VQLRRLCEECHYISQSARARQFKHDYIENTRQTYRTRLFVLLVATSAAKEEVSGMDFVSVADAGGAGAPFLVRINIDGVTSPEIGYLPLQISREMGCPTTGDKKLHPGTSDPTQIFSVFNARIVEVERSGSTGISFDGSVP